MATFPNAICRNCEIELKGVIDDYGGTWICKDCAIEEYTFKILLSALYCIEGDKVIVTESTAENGYDYDREQVKELLEIGKEYTIQSIKIGGCSSTLTLKEFPNIKFNTVNFVAQRKESKI